MSKTKIFYDLLLNNEEFKFLPGLVIDENYFKYLSEYHLKRKYFTFIKKHTQIVLKEMQLALITRYSRDMSAINLGVNNTG